MSWVAFGRATIFPEIFLEPLKFHWDAAAFKTTTDILLFGVDFPQMHLLQMC